MSDLDVEPRGETFDPGRVALGATGSSGEPVVIVGDRRHATDDTDPDGDQTNSDHPIVWCNRAFSEVLRAALSDLDLTPLSQVLTTVAGASNLSPIRTSTFDATLRARDGSVTHWEAVAVPASIDDGTCWMLTFRPPVVDRHLDELLRASEERFRALAERAPIGIFSSEVGLRFGYVNDRMAELTGAPAEGLLGTEWMQFVHRDDLDAVTGGLQSALDGESLDLPARVLTTTGEERWVNLRAVPVRTVGLPAAFLGTVEDVTDRRRVEELLAWQATHDSLTGLPNRSELATEIGAALDDGAESVALLFFYLDDFKPVNDTFGHAAGDQLLVTVATRLREAVRAHDVVFRLAGDEFVVLARHVSNDDEALGVANRVRHSVTRPVLIEGKDVSVGCSVGVVRATLGVTPEQLVHDADVAMYQAKQAGKGQTAIFDKAVRNERERRDELILRLRNDATDGRIDVVYSPVFDADDGTVVALEAHCGWSDPAGQPIDRRQIMRMADRAGFSVELGSSIFRRACADFSAWKANGIAPTQLCLDVTKSQLLAPGFVDLVARTALEHDLSAGELCLELDETSFVEDEVFLAPVIDELRQLGLAIALDDVGGGTTSLSVLTHAPVDRMKLDLALLGDADPATDALAAGIVAIAAARGIDVVACELRTDADAERASRLGFPRLQGPACGEVQPERGIATILGPGGDA